MQLTNN